jgi:hypothetical protein
MSLSTSGSLVLLPPFFSYINPNVSSHAMMYTFDGQENTAWMIISKR